MPFRLNERYYCILTFSLKLVPAMRKAWESLDQRDRLHLHPNLLLCGEPE